MFKCQIAAGLSTKNALHLDDPTIQLKNKRVQRNVTVDPDLEQQEMVSNELSGTNNDEKIPKRTMTKKILKLILSEP